MDTNPAVTIEKRKEMVREERREIDMEIVPDRYVDIISGEFAYDPVRLPLDQDPTQLLYDRKTLQTIWEIEQHARNPFTRQWFDIKSAIPQTELRKEMKRFIQLHRFPSKTLIGEYSKILDEGEMKRYLMTLRKYVEGTPISENKWTTIWKLTNIIRLFCEFHSENIKLFISLQGFRCFKNVILKILIENDAKEASLGVSKEIVRAIDVIINGFRSRGENSMGICGKLEENSGGRQHVIILSLLGIVRLVYDNNEGYIKIQSLVLRAFSRIFHEIDVDTNNIVLRSGNTIRAVLMGCQCAIKILYQANAKDISSEDLSHGIALLARQRVPPLEINEIYARALSNAVIICLSRETERSKETSGFTEGQLLEAEMQARHNSEALEKGVRLIRDIAMEESQLATCILAPGLDIVKELVHMFQLFIDTENEYEDGVGNRKFPVLICGNSCKMVQCVHYRVARDGLDISEAISRKGGPSLDVEILRKFIGVRTRENLTDR